MACTLRLVLYALYCSNSVAEREIQRLCVKCTNGTEEASCDWEGPMVTQQAHVDLCEFVPVACPRRCNERPMRKDLTEHLKKHCQYRAWECELCKEPGIYSDITGAHVCPSGPLHT